MVLNGTRWSAAFGAAEAVGAGSSTDAAAAAGGPRSRGRRGSRRSQGGGSRRSGSRGGIHRWGRWSRPTGHARLHDGFDVGPGDAVAGAGTDDRAGIETVLADEPSHDGRQQQARCLVGAVRARVGSGGLIRHGDGRGRERRRRGRDLIDGRGRSRRRRDRGRRRSLGSRGARGRSRRGIRSRSGCWGGGGFRRRGAVRADLPERASTAPTGTSAPSGARISRSTPDDGAGTSLSTLSVLILEQRLVFLHRVADGLEPPGDGSFGDRLAELGQRDVGHGESFARVSRGGSAR